VVTVSTLAPASFTLHILGANLVVRHGEKDGVESSLEAAVVAVRPAQAGIENPKLSLTQDEPLM
jgi:hypothetical protein